MESGNARILIVDDEAAQMHALCHTLEEQEFEVLGCANGEAALAALQQAPFDLLLADLMMPGMNGIALLRAALEIDPMLVGIIMTGEGTIGTAVEAMQSGALDYILKPFKLSAILPVLGRSLAMRRLRLENAALEMRVRQHAAELEAANHELDAANRELDAFTRSASHDLHSPLHAIAGFASLLVSELGPQVPKQQLGWLLRIERAARDMSQLIDDLMRLSRLGRQALKLQNVDVALLVRGVVDELRERQPRREPSLNVGDLPQIAADATMLRQVFVNLLSNAIKFTRNVEQAVIHVGCERRARELVLFVRDNGTGFDMAHAGQLFDAFHRLHGAHEFEGSGVGLSIAQGIVKRHGGRIWAEASPGHGATFFFTLGASTEHLSPAASSPDRSAESAAMPQMTSPATSTFAVHEPKCDGS
jgi:signal transduction histidine kinase